jgi:hypothetical protein
MSSGEILSLAIASEESILSGQKMLALIGSKNDDVDWLSKGLAKGHYKTREIQRDGAPQYVVFYSTDQQGRMVVNAAAFVGDGKPDPWLPFLGCEMIAREDHARGIMFMTARRGMIESAVKRGYEMTGTVLEKNLQV